MRLKVLIFFALFSLQIFANLCTLLLRENIKDFKFLRMSETYELKIKSTDEIEQVNFMGLFHSFDKEIKYYQFLNTKKNLIYIIKVGDIEISFDAEIAPLSKYGEMTEKRSKFAEISTQGPTGTCAAHAVYNCMLTMDLNNYLVDAKYYKDLNTERSRVELISRLSKSLYDAEGSLHNDLVTFINNEQGLKVYPIPTDPPDVFKNQIIEHLEMGWMVYLAFDIGKAMVPSTNQWLLNLETPKSFNLWKPREQNENTAGRHGLIIASVLADANGEKKLMVLDSNHAFPVLWDVNELDKVSSANMEAMTIWKDPTPQK